MNLKNQDKIKKIISIILLISWCLLIYYFSNQNGLVSENSSSRVLNFISKILAIDLYKYKYSMLIVRKLAHMFLYFILFILSLNVFSNFNVQKRNTNALLFCLIYSISDEVHQLFVIERSFGVSDILIDMLGAFLGYFFLKILFKFLKV